MTAPTLLDPAPRPSAAAPAGAGSPARPPKARRPWRAVLLGLTALLALALLVAALGADWSGGGDSTTSQDSRAAASRGAAAPQPEPQAPDLTAGASSGTSAPTAPGSTSALTAERVVKTGEVALVAPEGAVSSILTSVQRAAEAQRGVLASSTTQEYGDAPSGSVTVRVPVDSYGALLLQVRNLGAAVRSAQTSTTDVTGQSVDLDAQSRTLRDTRDQLLAIKGKAGQVGDILTVQQRIDDVTARINSIEGQAAVLRDQAAMSTLTVTVREAGDPSYGGRPDRPDGLGEAFRDAGSNFGSGLEAIVRASGALLLLVLCLLVLAPVVLFGRRLARRLS